MFVDFEPMCENDDDRVKYKLTDTDFIEIVNVPYGGWIAKSIIAVYERRGLNVAANLILLFSKLWPSDSISISIGRTKRNVPEYAKYADEVNRLLLLI